MKSKEHNNYNNLKLFFLKIVKNKFILVAFLIASITFFCKIIPTFFLANLQESPQIKAIFDKYKINGTFVIYDVSKNITLGHNKKRAKKQFTPASTFKIPNSAIALSEKIITNVDSIFYQHKGEEIFLPIWANDMSLREAMKHSNVPAFQQIARKIGLEKMQEYINKFDYGNKKIGSIIDNFWLEKPLKINAIEQIAFLQKLFNSNSYVSPSVQGQLKHILFLEEKNGWKLYGKTGWTRKVGWFVGWLEKNNKYHFFAFNGDLKNFEDLHLRQRITEEILVEVVKGYR